MKINLKKKTPLMKIQEKTKQKKKKNHKYSNVTKIKNKVKKKQLFCFILSGLKSAVYMRLFFFFFFALLFLVFS
jgi:hypothetical protein